jgi:hypothetical protein
VRKVCSLPDRRFFGQLASSTHTPIRLPAQSSDVKHPMNRTML